MQNITKLSQVKEIKMNILFYNELTPNKSIEKRFDKVVNMLQAGDFKSAKVKKMTGTEFYRAELNYDDRLLLQIKKCQGEKYIYLLEIIYNHEYNKSRFLRGAVIDGSKFEPINSPDEIDEDQIHELTFINPRSTKFYLQDKPISFDDDQADIYEHNLPLIITGPAGSGKTIVMLEKIKTLPGRILYVTRSKPLVDNTCRLYKQHGFENSDQTVDFLSYAEFQAAINPPSGKELQFDDFAKWLRPNMAACPIKNIQAMYEEFFGVITGATINSEYLSEEEYIKLGVRQSLIDTDDREAVYALFRKLLEYMQGNGFYHSDMHAFHSLEKCTPQYDYVVVDEVQDITNIQLALILKSLITPNCFMLGGDSHQIVHPSSFSWSNLKTMLQRFHADSPLGDIAINILPNNYRNSQAINEIANKLLRLKNVRFGSIDRESCYLSNGQSIPPVLLPYCLLIKKP